jgi:hypothetical protein
VKRIATAALALAAVLSAPALADAGTTPQQPVTTARAVTTTAVGQLPQSSLDAEWNSWRGGSAATLEVSGYGMSGTASTAVGTWTSPATAVSGSKLFATVNRVNERGVMSALPGTWTSVVRIRHRDAGGAWSRWITLGGAETNDGLVAVTGASQGWDISYLRATRAAQQLQVEVTYRVTDTSSNDLFTTVVVP